MVSSVLLFIIGRNKILFGGASVGFLVLLWLVWPAGSIFRYTVICSWLGTVLTVPVHELGHVLAARRVGAQTVRVGWQNGVAFVETERLSRRSTAIVAGAGPAASAVVAVAVLLTSWLLSVPVLLAAAAPWFLSALSIVPPARDGMLVFTGRASRRASVAVSPRSGVDAQEGESVLSAEG